MWNKRDGVAAAAAVATAAAARPADPAERRIDGGPGLPVVQLPRVFLQVEIAAESFPANPASELFCNQMISLLLMEL